GHDQGISRAGHGLELQVADVGAVPVAARVLGGKQSRVAGDEQVVVVNAVQVQIARGSEGEFLGLPALAAVGGIEQVALGDGPNLRAVVGSLQRLRWLLYEFVFTGRRSPSGA